MPSLLFLRSVTASPPHSVRIEKVTASPPRSFRIEEVAASPPPIPPLHRIADLARPKVRKAFLRAIDALHDYDEDALRGTLINGDLTGALTLLGIDAYLPTLLGAQFTQELLATTLRGVTLTVAQLADRPRIVSVLSVNPRAVRWAADHAATLVTSITESIRLSLRQTIAEGLQVGASPSRIARDVRQVIGLTERQARAVQAYRTRLLTTGMPGIEKKVDRYAARTLRNRAETIARTETMTAVSTAQRLTYETAYTEGALPMTVQQQWLTAFGSERTCAICGPMHKQTVSIGGQFRTGSGGLVSGPPIHPACRCALRLIL